MKFKNNARAKLHQVLDSLRILVFLESKTIATFTLYGLKYTYATFIVLFLFCFYDEVTYLQAVLHLMSLKTNLKIVLGLKVKNIEAQQKLRYSYKKVCM